jgi:hypothetical protein
MGIAEVAKRSRRPAAVASLRSRRLRRRAIKRGDRVMPYPQERIYLTCPICLYKARDVANQKSSACEAGKCGSGDFRSTLRVNFELFAVHSPFNEFTSQPTHADRLDMRSSISTSRHLSLSPSITYAAIVIILQSPSCTQGSLHVGPESQPEIPSL